MKPGLVTRLDRWAGVPICCALTGVRRVTGLFRRTKAGRPVRKLLFIKMTEQGATVLANNAIRAAAARVGRENIYFWVFEENRPILELMDLVPPENVISIKADDLAGFLTGVLKTLLRIRSLHIDATVDLELFARASAILGYLTGAHTRVGLHRFTTEGPYRGDLLTHRVQHNPYLHNAAATRLLVDAIWEAAETRPLVKILPHTSDLNPPKHLPQQEDLDHARSIARSAGWRPGRPIVLLNPNASDLLVLRKWPVERFIAVGRQLLENYPEAVVLITGSPGEAAAAEMIAREIGVERVGCAAGRTTLRQLLALYTISDVLVTNDSGPAHFACLTDIGIVVMFGPETPALYGPLSPNARVIWQGLACSPCVSALNHRVSPCKDNVCMKQISVERVMGEVERLLAAPLRVQREAIFQSISSDCFAQVEALPKGSGVTGPS